MIRLLVGFDSAWTATNAGAIVGTILRDDGTLLDLGPPQTANFDEAERILREWQATHQPTETNVLLDQPTIVRNPAGARPVEHIVGSAVSRRYGGMQPANLARSEMFGPGAPLWAFLDRFGGSGDPMAESADAGVIETYPVLTIISQGWLLPDQRPAGRLPKYNPGRRKKFSLSDWNFVCSRVLAALSGRGLTEVERWLSDAMGLASPRKADQDSLDACLCLLVALHLAEGKACLKVGDRQSGYIVVPDCADLVDELAQRCKDVGRTPSDWVRVFRWTASGT